MYIVTTEIYDEQQLIKSGDSENYKKLLLIKNDFQGSTVSQTIEFWNK
jgi:hypothetical protein